MPSNNYFPRTSFPKQNRDRINVSATNKDCLCLCSPVSPDEGQVPQVVVAAALTALSAVAASTSSSSVVVAVTMVSMVVVVVAVAMMVVVVVVHGLVLKREVNSSLASRLLQFRVFLVVKPLTSACWSSRQPPVPRW